ncbi:hypothetical protein E2C01_084207 [Portunus trituberculatus]|uniref:Uncharacterized protein n=1 Tax=Portunus trituberculatus TaxID=210409 RepID=A0A5B7J3N3_PORTR|nr:hypothetical protein [Portunus trituberculatus]
MYVRLLHPSMCLLSSNECLLCRRCRGEDARMEKCVRTIYFTVGGKQDSASLHPDARPEDVRGGCFLHPPLLLPAPFFTCPPPPLLYPLLSRHLPFFLF